MGTLHSQTARTEHAVDLEVFLQKAAELANKHKLTVADVIAAKHALELQRSNDLYRSNGEAFDEQISGIGGILEELSAALQARKAI